MVGDRRSGASNGSRNGGGGGDTSLVLSEGEEKRRLVLERKALQDQEKHERLVRRLTLVEDRRQAVIEERKRKAQEASVRLNERLAQVSANRRIREQQDREKREAAVRRRDTTNSERSASAAANLTGANRNGFPKSGGASTNGGHLSGGVPVRSASTHVTFTPRFRDGTSSRLTKNRLSQPTIELDINGGTVQRSKSSRYSSATTLPTSSYRPNRNPSTPIPNASSTLPRSKSQRLPVTPGTASSSGTSSVRTSTDSARGVKLASEKGKTDSSSGAASTVASLRRAQSLSVKRKPIPPREPTEKKEKPTANKETPTARPATKQPLMPTKIDFSQKGSKASPAPSAQSVASSAETTSVEVSSAELEFKKKLAEKRRLARENQLKKEEEAAMATKVIAHDVLSGEETNQSNKDEPQINDSNVNTVIVTSGKPSIVESLEGVSDEPVDHNRDFGRFDEAVSSLQSVVSSRHDSSAETSPRDGPSSEKENNSASLVDDLSDAERKKKEREARVAERMRLMEAEREQERSKKEAEEREREEREKEREKQLDEQRRQEEEERRARKAKLDAIMARTRLGGGGASTITNSASGVSASTALSSGAASAILANIRQNQKPQPSPDSRVDDEERETDAEILAPTKKSADQENAASVNPVSSYDASNANNIEVNHVYSSSGDSRGGAGNEFVTTSVEHESPGGSKIASPCGAETMSPVPDRHSATFVINHHSNLTAVLTGDENGNLEDGLDRDDDKHFEQIIDLGSESRFVNRHQQGVSSSKAEESEDRSPTLDSSSQQKFGLTESRQVSGDNDNAEHSQFPF